MTIRWKAHDSYDFSAEACSDGSVLFSYPDSSSLAVSPDDARALRDALLAILPVEVSKPRYEVAPDFGPHRFRVDKIASGETRTPVCSAHLRADAQAVADALNAKEPS